MLNIDIYETLAQKLHANLSNSCLRDNWLWQEWNEIIPSEKEAVIQAVKETLEYVGGFYSISDEQRLADPLYQRIAGLVCLPGREDSSDDEVFKIKPCQ